jgi:agmatinase
MKTPRNFCGLFQEHASYTNARAVVLPVPFDRTGSWKRGARRGPSAIIEASRYLELYDIETDSEVYRKGIHTAGPVRAVRSEKMIGEVQRRVRGYLADGKLAVTLGGDHSVIVGSVRAHAERYPDLTLLQLDAHTDLRGEYDGNPYSHASVMARALEQVQSVVSVGIRSMFSADAGSRAGVFTLTAAEIMAGENWIPAVTGRLGPDVYVTIDMDVFDPAAVPSTGTPEPGGLDWYQVTGLLRAVARSSRIVGFDVVELMPTSHHASDFTAAKLVYKVLSYILVSR